MAAMASPTSESSEAWDVAGMARRTAKIPASSRRPITTQCDARVVPTQLRHAPIIIRPLPLLYRERIQGRADASDDPERRCAEQALPDAVAGAVGGERFQVEHLAQGEA